jgi:riboflavin synthase
MFTGIIEQKSPIISIIEWKFEVKNIFWDSLKIGQSIAHDGACMTIETFNDNTYTFFVMEESLHKTNFWEKKAWDYFNIERCLKAEDRIDGHFVSGHIDTTWEISLLEVKDDNSLVIWITFPKEFSKLTIKKWSIAINGVSLTIVDKEPGYISVSLIPLTQDWTNLGDIKIWEWVNLEFDMLGKYILNTQNDS